MRKNGKITRVGRVNTRMVYSSSSPTKLERQNSKIEKDAKRRLHEVDSFENLLCADTNYLANLSCGQPDNDTNFHEKNILTSICNRSVSANPANSKRIKKIVPPPQIQGNFYVSSDEIMYSSHLQLSQNLSHELSGWDSQQQQQVDVVRLKNQSTAMCTDFNRKPKICSTRPFTSGSNPNSCVNSQFSKRYFKMRQNGSEQLKDENYHVMDGINNKSRDVSCQKLCNSLVVCSDENGKDYLKNNEQDNKAVLNTTLYLQNLQDQQFTSQDKETYDYGYEKQNKLSSEWLTINPSQIKIQRDFSGKNFQETSSTPVHGLPYPNNNPLSLNFSEVSTSKHSRLIPTLTTETQNQFTARQTYTTTKSTQATRIFGKTNKRRISIMSSASGSTGENLNHKLNQEIHNKTIACHFPQAEDARRRSFSSSTSSLQEQQKGQSKEGDQTQELQNNGNLTQNAQGNELSLQKAGFRKKSYFGQKSNTFSLEDQDDQVANQENQQQQQQSNWQSQKNYSESENLLCLFNKILSKQKEENSDPRQVLRATSNYQPKRSLNFSSVNAAQQLGKEKIKLVIQEKGQKVTKSICSTPFNQSSQVGTPFGTRNRAVLVDTSNLQIKKVKETENSNNSTVKVFQQSKINRPLCLPGVENTFQSTSIGGPVTSRLKPKQLPQQQNMQLCNLSNQKQQHKTFEGGIRLHDLNVKGLVLQTPHA